MNDNVKLHLELLASNQEVLLPQGQVDLMSSDMGNILDDKELINALKRVTIGLGKLFDDIYP